MASDEATSGAGVVGRTAAGAGGSGDPASPGSSTTLPREPTGSDESRFRPDLEGLRAIAVVLVLAYHARVPRFAGGFVGVDVFFVLSGFLITGLLIRELGATGRVSFSRFYARRARRLLPAAALVLVATAVASFLVLPPLQMTDVSRDIASAAAYVSNMRFALQATDYLAADAAPSPVLHFWSLSVEEQFYLFWPALLVVASAAAYRAGDIARGARRVGTILALVLVGSFALSVWLTTVQQPWAFFSLPTRAWELALGGLLALPFAARFVPAAIAPVLGWLGLALVVLSGVVLDATTPFPGLAALLPTVGSALVVASALRRDAPAAPSRIPGPGPLLSLGPVRYMGRISYSLYLWHWPLLVLPAVMLGEALPGPARLALVGLSVVVAAASQRWVEDPIRHGRYVGFQPRRVLASAGALTVVVVAVAVGFGALAEARLVPDGPAVGGTLDEVPVASGVAVVPVATPSVPVASPGPTSAAVTPGTTPRPTASPTLPPLAAAPVPADLAPSLARAQDDNPLIYSDGCHVEPVGEASGTCVYGDASSATTVVLFGDSHAAQWFPALQRLATEHGWRLVSLTKSACTSLDVPVWSASLNRPYHECTAWREAAFDRIRAERPALVVVATSTGYRLDLDGRSVRAVDDVDAWTAGLDRTIGRIRDAGSRALVIGDTPRMTADPPVCLSEHLDDASACANPFARAVSKTFRSATARTATDAGAAFVDPTGWLCSTDPCPAVIGRFLVYRDTHHMTATFSRALARTLFEAAGLSDLGGQLAEP